ncbi:hypothetical protein ACQPZX_27870 [Actinoplanes sp. CA-142083]|uniref:hypothetical protein n=1 Tax=Actinoplanes sp. CA-142083 TaxID=3239903 RepID=UPI003D8D4944
MSGESRLQSGHWLLIGLAVLVVAGGITVILRRGDADPTVAGPSGTPSAAPSASATPRPDCAPQITSTWADGRLFSYGMVYRSKCDQVVRKLRFRVAAVNKAGDEVSTDDTIAFGGVLFPGAELAVAGPLQLPKGAQVSGLKAQVIDYTVQPAPDFSGWARPEVVDLARGKPGAQGMSTVTGTVKVEPPSTPICVSDFVLIMRDKADKIVYADVDPTVGQTLVKPEFQVPPVPAADFARTKIYAPQTPRTQKAPAAGVPCDGS